MTTTGKLSALMSGLVASAALLGAAVPAGASAAAAHPRPGFQFPEPAVGLVKSASIPSYSAAGTPVTYTYEVTNTGDVTLANVTVTDPMPGLSAIDCGGGTNVIASLAVGASQACTASYTTTAQDVTNGSITNVGTAASAGPAGTVSDNSSLTIPETGYPFTCQTPTHYLSQSTTSSGPTQLYYASPNGSPPPLYTYSPLGPAYGRVYNALGFDPANDYLYALAKTSPPKLLRIDSAGNVTVLGPISTGSNPPLSFSAVGAFDTSGNYWIREGSTTGGTVADEIDVTSSPPSLISTLTLSAPFRALDWTMLPAYPDYLWGLSGRTIYQASTVTGTVTSFSTGFSVASGTYGAAWTFGNGNLGFSNNATGQINEISVSGTAASPSFTLVAQYYGPGVVTVNDGAACIGQGTDLGIVKTGPATVAPGGTITWDLTVTNDGPGNSSGFAVHDAIPAGITGVTTSTPNCTVTSKGRDVECAEANLDNGDSYTITLSGTAPKKPGACVVNTATVTANETDPNPANDTSSAKTCIT